MKSNIIRQYLDLMHQQREDLFTKLAALPEELIWKRPAPREWSVGENLDHMRVLYRSTMPLVGFSWWGLSPFANLQRHKTYTAAIDNVYLRPGFPQKVGWMWPPKYTLRNPAPLDTLHNLMSDTHSIVDRFYSEKDPACLGHVKIWDPAIGRLNLVQVLRVGIYHDELHDHQIDRTLVQIQQVDSFTS